MLSLGGSNSVKDDPEKRPKRALVLSGGGSRGAYEVGVVKALIEQGIEFDFAFGTSIGGINAAFIASGNFDRLEHLWNTLLGTDLFRMPTIDQIRLLLKGSRWGLLDTAPLEKLLFKELNLQKFKESTMKVGLLTTDLCTLQTRVITTDEIESLPELVDVLMASSAIPIIFPSRSLNGEGMWMDSGLVRNTPIQTAINMGAKEIYTVMVQADNDGSCPQNILQVLTRCADILLYASAKDGIKLVQEYNKIIDQNASPEVLHHKLGLKVFQPDRNVILDMLDIKPVSSKYLMRQGYEDGLRQLAEQGI